MKIDSTDKKKAVIMAGGEGVRLRPFTYIIPKPLLPLGDSTILDHTINCLIRSGFDEIFISVNYRSKNFDKWMSDVEKYSANIRLIKERKKLGTAGPLYLMKDFLNEDFCMLYGDLIIKVKLDEMYWFHKQKKADITIGITKHCLTIPYAIVEKDGDETLLEMHEKPTYQYCINSGIYVLNPSIFKFLLNEKYTDMPELIDNIKKAGGGICVYDVGDCWMDMGQFSDYEKAVDVIEKWEE